MRRRRNAIKLSNDYQSLEPRKLLAADITFSAGVLTIAARTGENAAEVAGSLDSGVTVTFNPEYEHGDPVVSETFTGVEHILYSGNHEADIFYNNTDIPCTAYGRGGDDILDGGDADDNLVYGAGTDGGDGGAGNDRMVGGNGTDYLSGGDGNDRILGSAGGERSSRLSGGAGDDVIFGGSGEEHISGGDGNDRLIGNGAPEGRRDTIWGQAGDDILYGGHGQQNLDGGLGNDRVFGQGGDDYCYGGEGDDVVNGGEGDDYVEGDNSDKPVTATTVALEVPVRIT